ncbi:hypothetical protein EAO73_22170 [Streptomyces sp. col6]|uniref:hypothetical protein n=1 Tax=Streptomyces sp. col6 TaxID=2478958 RepID=UPI0011CD7AD8|nr:hypothetical protein [Streptomyces sp. col6]TXS03768.1 hypothetical protein EAO73_22170 [Streptomyces sp. col6]
MNDATDEIAAALSGPGPDAEVALRVLRLAFRWAGAALEGVDGAESGAPALAALFALEDALEESGALAAALPALLEAAMPGEAVGGGTEGLMRKLDTVRARVREERERTELAHAALEKLAAAEEALRGRLAEHEALRRQVDDLRRLERLVLALDALQEQQEVIAERLATLRGRDAGVEGTLRTSSDALVRLSEDQLAALAPRTRQVLERAEAAQRALAAEEREHGDAAADLAERQARLERIRESQGDRVASLRRYAAVDRELAGALAAPGGAPSGTVAPEHRVTLAEVEAAGDEIERRLGAADEALRRVLAERDARDRDGKTVVHRAG